MNKLLAVTAFFMLVTANSLFSQCTGVQSATITPTPTGSCPVGTVYTICYTMNTYNQLGANWVDGYEVNLTGPWQAGSLVGTTAPINCGGGVGNWIWSNAVTGTASGQTHGPGYYFDLNPDGNPGNDFGDSGPTCSWTMCFQVTVGNSPGATISVGVTALSDGEVGSWNSSSCSGSNYPIFSCIIDNPCGTVSAVVNQNESCAGNNDGQATVTMTGGANPITYSWNTAPIQTTQTATGLAAGNYTATVTDANGCTLTDNVTITAGGSSDATINNVNGTNTLCENDAAVQLTTVQAGGTFSGNGVSPTGLFTPANANNGANTITYTIGGACPDSETLTITVLPNADATITDPIPNYPGNAFCINDPPEQLTAADLGGTWTGNGVNATGLFNPATAGAGNHAITYTIPNPCGDSDVINIVVNAASDATINNANATNTFCANDPAIQLTTVQGGGTFSGIGVSSTGLFTPNSATIGTNTITYNIGGNCPDVQTLNITVISNANATITDPIPGYPGNLLCEDDASVQLQSAQAGGTWSGNGVSVTGLFNPSTAGVGNYAITYSIPNPCGDSDVINVTVQAVSDATINNINPNNELCENDAAVQITTLQAGGTFSGTGVSLSGLFTPANASIGNNTITYTISGNCPDSQTMDISVFTNADATITDPIANYPGNLFCLDDSPEQLITADLGGVWSGPGISATGVFDPAVAGVGLHVINYDIAGLCGDADAINITVEDNSDATINNANANNEFCEDDAGVQLTTLQAGGTFTGTGVSSSGWFTPSTATSGVNTITYSIGGNCPDSQTLDITVFERADATMNLIYGTNQLCLETGPVQITATTAGGIYSGNGVSATGLFSPATAGAGVHTITYSVADPCGDIQTMDVTVTEVTMDFATTPSICTADNGSATATVLSGTSPFAYYWLTTPAQYSQTATNLAPGTYDLTVQDNVGCEQTASVLVGFDPSDLTATVVSFTDATCFEQCDGTATASGINGTTPYQYLWDDPVLQVTTICTGLCAGTFNVGVEDANGCLATAQVVISEPTEVTVTAVMDSQANCGQADGVATATPMGGTVASSYSYSWNSSPVQTTATATGLLPGTYTVTVADDNNCSASVDVTITSTPGFTASISAFNDAACFEGCNGNATVTASAGTVGLLTYSWNTVPAQTSQTAIDLCAGDYIAVITDDVGCIGTDTASISEPLEVATVLTTSVSQICIGQSATLSATASGGTTPYTAYTWTANPADGSLLTTQQNPTVSPIVTTTYGLIAEDVNGCVSPVQTITITVLPPLTLNVTRPAFNPDTAICPYDFAILDLQGVGGDGNFSYFILPDNTNPVQFPMQVQPNATTTYDFMVSDGCTTPFAFASSTVTVHTLPDVIFTGNDLDGCHVHTTEFTDATSPTPIAWNWNFGDPSSGANTSPSPNATHQFSSAGTYNISLSVTTADGCVSDTSFPNYVEVYPLPYANFSATPERTNLLQSTIDFRDESTGVIAEWYWNFGDGDESNDQHVEHAYLDTGTYLVSLTVVTDHGCEDFVRRQVIIDPDFMFYVPNTFTPNNDGRNDEFRGYGLGVKWDTYTLWVYNRWGEEIFYSNDIEHPWDGVYKGMQAPDEVYVWKIELYDLVGEHHIYRGRVTLLR